MSSNMAPTSPLSHIGPFSLVIPPTTYCAGSDVAGEVVLDFKKLQHDHVDEVIVTLRGTLNVSMSSNGGDPQTHELVSLTQSLWKRGAAYPPPDSHVLHLPFRFCLPSGPEILPSVCWREGDDEVAVTYYAEAIGLRPTSSSANSRQVRESLTVVSRGDPSLRVSIRSLGRTEGGLAWKTAHRETRMRRGLWGEYCTARVELLVPNEHGILPHCVDVPVIVKVKTTTARLARAKADRHPEGKPVFPAVEIESHPICIRLRRRFTLKSGRYAQNSVDETLLTTAKKRDLLSTSYRQWVDDTEPRDREEMGKWVQQWVLQPSVRLNRFPPTFSCDFVDCAYTLSVEVPFQGIGNEVTVAMPITLDSGIDQAMPRGSSSDRTALWVRQTGTTWSDTTSSGGSGGGDLPGDEGPSGLPP
ncbi:hypothetical protein LXA43DRAFT_448948 [Ganoderma leucocontextum]|nr:hypothetical protein LXA43DRAFT_448948 [Ganoderma leucocontextum]